MKVRVRFSKLGVMRYVGHLDMLRYFQKAVNRAKLPISYSDGFNPHQIMSFGAPLGLGMTSDGEYMDIDITEDISSEYAVNVLNENMVPSVIVHSFKYLPERTQNAMAAHTASSYKIFVKKDDLEQEMINSIATGLNKTECIDTINEKISSFCNKTSHLVVKKTKKSEKEIDILPLIYDFHAENVDDKVCFYMLVSAGSTDNLKPEIVLQEFFKEFDLEIDKIELSMHRIDMFTGDKDNLISLNDVGENH